MRKNCSASEFLKITSQIWKYNSYILLDARAYVLNEVFFSLFFFHGNHFSKQCFHYRNMKMRKCNQMKAVRRDFLFIFNSFLINCLSFKILLTGTEATGDIMNLWKKMIKDTGSPNNTIIITYIGHEKEEEDIHTHLCIYDIYFISFCEQHQGKKKDTHIIQT